MSKEVDKIRRRVIDHMDPPLIYQDRPITIVRVNVCLDGVLHQVFSWSKVMRPDRWDPERGKKVAIGKATKKIAKAIHNGEVCEEVFEPWKEEKKYST